MKLKALSLPDLEKVRLWRNEQQSMLRTPFLLTQEQQARFYSEVICNRQANARFWGIWYEDEFIGMLGIESIELENRRGEISLITDPKYCNNIRYKQALLLLLDKGFDSLNLDNIWGECYECNDLFDFWVKAINELCGTSCKMENTKFFNGKYYNSLYFNFNKAKYLKGEMSFGETPKNQGNI